ncbi:recombinase family protein [Paenibacillus glacialis]|uniref:Recombinase domain-containing protein n=1 Tax=Paenibacillus glacialis TaxID=494026 RepID=A0A168NP32_9BACL|nr:recombinase family protein [Paenibacillus glacialis]OAB45985.1 hypothetical protein PGLA_00890 [Paenibacillus glacialis]
MITLTGNEKLKKSELDALVGLIKALVYVRVSTDGQVDNYSIESQIQRCINEAKEKFFINENEIIVLVEDGESGDNPNRPMINYILFLFSKGIGNKVIFLHPDRLSRYLNLQQQISHEIWGMGCDLHFVEFDLNKDNAESMLNFNIQGSIAQYNKAKILANTKRGRKTMVNNGKIPGLNRIYGYTFDKDLDILVTNDVEKEVYLTMVKMILNKSSCSEIARTLSKKSIEAPKGSKWYQATISRILRNPTYKGIYYHGKTEIVQKNGKKTKIDKAPDEWVGIPIPQYIDEATFLRVQKYLDDNVKGNKNSGRPSEDYLLKGLARCGRCGSSVSSGITSKTKKRLLKYYSCTQKTKKSFEVGTGESNPLCRGRNWRVDNVDNIIWNRIPEILKTPETIIRHIVSNSTNSGKLDEIRHQKTVLEKEKIEKKSAVERYLDLYATGYIKTKQALDEKIGELNNQIDDIEKDIIIIIDTLKYTDVEVDQIQLFESIFEKYKYVIESNLISTNDKKLLVNFFFEKVIFHEDELEIVLRVSDYEHLKGSRKTK